MTGNLKNVSSVATQVAEGNLAVDWKVQSEKDTLGKALNLMVGSMRDRVNMILESADKMSKESDKIAHSTQEVGDVTTQIATNITQIAKGTSEQADSIGRTAISVEQLNWIMNNVAKGAKTEAEAVHKASDMTNLITEKIASVNENTQASAQDSAGAARTAQAGAATIESSVHSMQNIKTSTHRVNEKVRLMGARSKQIGSIVETIEEITAQTNLLALNAAIEAARAGDAGKGFAVVADEVRKLARKSATSAKEITGLVRGIQQIVAEAVSAIDEEAADVDNGVERSNEAAHALTDILTSIETINCQIENIASAAQEMNNYSTQLASSMGIVLAVSEENTASAEKMAKNSAEVTQAVENIARVSEENSKAVTELSASAERMSAEAVNVAKATQDLDDLAVELQQKTMRLTVKKVTGKTSRGQALLGRVNFVKERYGEEAWGKVLRSLEKSVQAIFEKGVDPSGEYPPEVLGQLTNAIRKELAGGSDEILREMTAYRAKFDVLPGGALSQHFRMGDPGFTIRRMDLCLRHNWGEGVIVRYFELGPNHIRQEVDMGRKQPRERCTYNHVGWMEGAIIAAGGIPHITKTKCMHDGAPFCEYDISWEMPKK
jgi:methyl-accepting chemotaxis protein